MGTLGMVTVFTGRRVSMKIVVGTDGQKAGQVAQAIKRLDEVPSVETAYHIAGTLGFGTIRDLVVVTPSEIKMWEGLGEADPLYRLTFYNPNFNPHLDCGVSDHLETVRFPAQRNTPGSNCGTLGAFRPGEDVCRVLGCGQPRSYHQVKRAPGENLTWDGKMPYLQPKITYVSPPVTYSGMMYSQRQLFSR